MTNKMAVWVALCMTALPCAAWKNPVKYMSAFRKMPQAAVEQGAAYRVVRGKILPSRVCPKVPVWQTDLEKYVARAAAVSRLQSVVFTIQPSSPERRQMLYTRYCNVMDRFNAFKKKTDPFLYYQLKPSEKRAVTPAQRAFMMSEILPLERDLRHLSVIVNVHRDPALAFALEYVARVRDEVSPTLRGMSGVSVNFSRHDRKFVSDEFFLAEQEFLHWTSGLRYGVAYFQAVQLPAGLRVAVLNDQPDVLARMTRSHEKGVFIKNGSLACFSRADKLLESIGAGAEYDVILTDLIVPDGGGYYLTHRLRVENFSGAIIALSAYERDDVLGNKLFSNGFDGMLNMPLMFERYPFWEGYVMSGINRYFSLRQKNGWAH